MLKRERERERTEKIQLFSNSSYYWVSVNCNSAVGSGHKVNISSLVSSTREWVRVSVWIGLSFHFNSKNLHTLGSTWKILASFCIFQLTLWTFFTEFFFLYVCCGNNGSSSSSNRLFLLAWAAGVNVTRVVCVCCTIWSYSRPFLLFLLLIYAVYTTKSVFCIVI